jgi:hypothetical protein
MGCELASGCTSITSNAKDYLGGIDYPGKANPPGLSGDKPRPEAKGKASAPGQTGGNPGHDPKGKALGLQRDKAADDDSAPPVPSARPQEAGGKAPFSNTVPLDPASYSHREILAVNLAPAVAELARFV